jgi:tetratricopeptide (TPR) repeat protein
LLERTPAMNTPSRNWQIASNLLCNASIRMDRSKFPMRWLGKLALFSLLSLWLAGQQVGAQSGEINAASVAMLPAYCKHAMLYRDKVPGGNDAAQIEHWSRLLGSGFAHIHHYCNGLLQTNTAMVLLPSNSRRQSLLQISIGEFDYVIRNVPQNYVLLPEILTKKGQNLIRIGRGTESVPVMEQAMQLKADYWPAYAYLSDYYKEIGEHRKAREVLKKGLAHAPQAKALTLRLAGLERESRKDR